MTEQTPSAQSLVAEMKHGGELRDARLEQAFLRVPREAFLPGLPPEQVYVDKAIPIKRDPDGSVVSSSSQPSMMALMIEQLRLAPGMNVLEIGAGSGYNAAIMQEVVGKTGRVTTIEYDPVIAQQAQDNLQRAAMSGIMVVHGDGAAGFDPRAAYDRIIATVGVWDVPSAWVRQLKPRGIIVAPIWLEGWQYSAAFQAQPDGSLFSERNLPCGFVRLKGPLAGPEVEMRVGTGSLVIYTGGSAQFDRQAIAMLSEDISEGYLGLRLEARDWTQGLIPYLLLTLAQPFIAGSYYAAEGQQPYGLEGSGVAILSRGSVCFIPIHEAGRALVFGGADALLAAQDVVTAWAQTGKPTLERLRLRLTPRDEAQPAAQGSARRIFERNDHYLEVWLA